jgi:transposase
MLPVAESGASYHCVRACSMRRIAGRNALAGSQLIAFTNALVAGPPVTSSVRHPVTELREATRGFYGCAPTILVPDNPRVGVTKADLYEPELQRSYEEMAAHFGITVIPARPYKPRDKPRVESTVLLVCRWVLARLRHQRFFSVEELNAAIKPLLAALNDRPFQKLHGSRRSVFESLDRPAMRPLPSIPYVYAEWQRVRAAFDYHVDVDRHYYSVPHALVGQELAARFSASTVEVFHRNERVASHVRSYQRGAHTTISEHMPKSHRGHAEWTPDRLIHWAPRSEQTPVRSWSTC